MNLSKLQQSLFILHKCASTVNRVWSAMEQNREKGPIYSMFHYSHNLAYYVIMETVAFLDEYNKYFVPAHVEPEFRQRVTEVRKVVKPILREIFLWSDLITYRNKVIAHGWREEKRGNELTLPHATTYKVPRSAFEFQLLKDYVLYVEAIITMEFETEIGEAILLGYHGTSIKRADIDYTNINTKLQSMLDEMNATADSLGKNYDLKIHGYRFND